MDLKHKHILHIVGVFELLFLVFLKDFAKTVGIKY